MSSQLTTRLRNADALQRGKLFALLAKAGLQIAKKETLRIDQYTGSVISEGRRQRKMGTLASQLREATFLAFADDFDGLDDVDGVLLAASFAKPESSCDVLCARSELARTERVKEAAPTPSEAIRSTPRVTQGPTIAGC